MLIIIDFSVEREKKKKGRSRLFSHLFQQNRGASTWFVSNGSFKWKVMSALACLSYPGSVRLHTANGFLPALVVNKNLSRVTPQKKKTDPEVEGGGVYAIDASAVASSQHPLAVYEGITLSSA